MTTLEKLSDETLMLIHANLDWGVGSYCPQTDTDKHRLFGCAFFNREARKVCVCGVVVALGTTAEVLGGPVSGWEETILLVVLFVTADGRG